MAGKALMGHAKRAVAAVVLANAVWGIPPPTVEAEESQRRVFMTSPKAAVVRPLPNWYRSPYRAGYKLGGRWLASQLRHVPPAKASSVQRSIAAEQAVALPVLLAGTARAASGASVSVLTVMPVVEETQLTLPIEIATRVSVPPSMRQTAGASWWRSPHRIGYKLGGRWLASSAKAVHVSRQALMLMPGLQDAPLTELPEQLRKFSPGALRQAQPAPRSSVMAGLNPEEARELHVFTSGQQAILRGISWSLVQVPVRTTVSLDTGAAFLGHLPRRLAAPGQSAWQQALRPYEAVELAHLVTLTPVRHILPAETLFYAAITIPDAVPPTDIVELLRRFSHGQQRLPETGRFSQYIPLKRQGIKLGGRVIASSVRQRQILPASMLITVRPVELPFVLMPVELQRFMRGAAQAARPVPQSRYLPVRVASQTLRARFTHPGPQYPYADPLSLTWRLATEKGAKLGGRMLISTIRQKPHAVPQQQLRLLQIAPALAIPSELTRLIMTSERGSVVLPVDAWFAKGRAFSQTARWRPQSVARLLRVPSGPAVSPLAPPPPDVAVDRYDVRFVECPRYSALTVPRGTWQAPQVGELVDLSEDLRRFLTGQRRLKDPEPDINYILAPQVLPAVDLPEELQLFVVSQDAARPSGHADIVVPIKVTDPAFEIPVHLRKFLQVVDRHRPERQDSVLTMPMLAHEPIPGVSFMLFMTARTRHTAPWLAMTVPALGLPLDPELERFVTGQLRIKAPADPLSTRVLLVPLSLPAAEETTRWLKTAAALVHTRRHQPSVIRQIQVPERGIGTPLFEVCASGPVLLVDAEGKLLVIEADGHVSVVDADTKGGTC